MTTGTHPVNATRRGKMRSGNCMLMTRQTIMRTMLRERRGTIRNVVSGRTAEDATDQTKVTPIVQPAFLLVARVRVEKLDAVHASISYSPATDILIPQSAP